MGVIKKINEMELVGGVINRDVYPVTATSAVYDKNNRNLDEILKSLEQGGGGEGGDVALASRTVIVFKSGDPNGDAPHIPQGGVWDLISNEITGIKGGWSTNDKLTPPVWMSTGEFLATAPSNPTWTFPVRISGEKGSDGTDGINTEFIFCRTKNELNPPPAPKNNPTVTGFYEAPWTNHPEGVTQELQVEWICSRIKNKDTGRWENWQPVPGEGGASSFAIWSKWGVKGKDGDGVEYIYYINDGSPVNNPTPVSSGTWLIDFDEYQEKGSFEGKEYIPSGWTDNPPKISNNENKTHIWVSVRKFKKNPLDPNTNNPINGGILKDREALWGAFSNPVPWVTFVESGISVRTLYIKKTIGETPKKPSGSKPSDVGSSWSAIFPEYNVETESVWKIEAYVTWDDKFAEVKVDTNNQVTTVKGWQGPWICTGIKGRDSIPRSYKTYIYRTKEGSVPPDAPSTGISVEEILGQGIWKDFPDSNIGNWWQCVGDVNGSTNTVEKWGTVVPLNGKDGTAKDGKWTEFRFKVSEDLVVSLSPGEEAERNPSGWSTDVPYKGEKQYLFMIKAIINPSNTLEGTWSNPVRISGEKGPKGDVGPASTTPGPSGTPGVSMAFQYALGTSENRVEDWQDEVPSTTEMYPYIWCHQGKDNHQGSISWEKEFRLSGINGLNGEPGLDGRGLTEAQWSYSFESELYKDRKDWEDYLTGTHATYRIINYEDFKVGDLSYIRGYIKDEDNKKCILFIKITGIDTSSSIGAVAISFTGESFIAEGKQGSAGIKGQFIYPKGIYSSEETYALTETTAPFVWDPLFNAYYVYNSDTPWVDGKEPGTNISKTPGQSNTGNAKDKFWVKFEQFKALYANLAIIPNGLFGSSVFNGDFMFSQQGKGNVLYNTRYDDWNDAYKDYSKNRLLNMGWTEEFPETSEDVYYIKYTSTEKRWEDPFLTFATITTSDYELFNPSQVYTRDSLFNPNICINFKTGECWFAGGEFYINSKGNGSIGKDGITWNTKGKIDLRQIYKNWTYLTASANTTIKLPDGRNYAIQVPPSKNGSATIILPSDKSNDGVELKILLYPSEMSSGTTTKIDVTIESRDENGNSKSNVWHSDGVNNFLFAKGAKFTVGGIYTFHSVIINDELHWVWTLG